MGRSRNLADVISGAYDIPLSSLDNVPASNDASALTTGTLPIARIADGAITAGKLADTYLTPTGDGSGLTGLSSSSSSIDVALDSGASVSANGAVSVASNGNIANYPVLNTISSEVDMTALGYNAQCPDGQTRMRYVVSGTYSNTMTVYGQVRNPTTLAITESATTFNVTADSGNGNHWQSNHHVEALGNNYYFGYVRNARDAGGAYSRVDVHGFVFKVDPSTGVPTKLGETGYLTTDGNWPYGGGGVISPTHMYIYTHHTGPNILRYREIRFNPSTETMTTANISSSTWNVTGSGGRYYTHKTSDASKLLSVSGNTFRSQPLQNSGTEINHTAATTSSLRTDYTSDGRVSFHPTQPYAIYFYRDTTNFYKFVLYSISSNGTLTEEDVLDVGATKVWSDGELHFGSSYKEFICKGDKGWTTGLIDASNNFVGLGVPVTYYGIDERSTKINDTTFAVQGNGTNGQFVRTFTVNAYQTDPFQFMGFADNTASSGNVSVTIAGVKDGFTGLQVGSDYYVATSYDGAINTNSTTGTAKVGKAISPTEILLAGG